MPETLQPADLVAEIVDLKRRMAIMEKAAPMRNTSMREGTFVVTDADGDPRVTMGLLDDQYGIEVRNEDGQVVYLANGAGVEVPRQDMQITKSNDSVIVTSGSFVNTWTSVLALAVADAVQIQTVIAADGGTTAEVRLAINLSGTTYSATQVVPAGTANAYEWTWSPAGLAVGGGPIIVDVQVRRTGGAGNVYAYPPLQAFMATADSLSATATGV